MVNQEKTRQQIRILLPEYLEAILQSYHVKGGRLLPKISNVNLNLGGQTNSGNGWLGIAGGQMPELRKKDIKDHTSTTGMFRKLRGYFSSAYAVDNLKARVKSVVSFGTMKVISAGNAIEAFTRSSLLPLIRKSTGYSFKLFPARPMQYFLFSRS